VESSKSLFCPPLTIKRSFFNFFMPDAIAPLQPSRVEILLRLGTSSWLYSIHQVPTRLSVLRMEEIQQSVTGGRAMAPRVYVIEGPTTCGLPLKNFSGNLSINEIEAWFLTEKILVSLPFFGRDGRSISGPLFRTRRAAQHLDLSETAGRSSYGCWSAKGSGIASTEGKR
jgi:hypothetical protein